MKTCSVNGCEKTHLAKGFCSGHYQRLRKTGSLDEGNPIDRAKNLTGSKNGKWNGGVSFDRKRVRIYSPDHPYATDQGYVYRYRLAMEKKLGRFLFPSEIVHHKDGDESNDNPENLEVISQSQHIKLHLKEMKGRKWLTAVKLANKRRKKT